MSENADERATSGPVRLPDSGLRQLTSGAPACYNFTVTKTVIRRVQCRILKWY